MKTLISRAPIAAFLFFCGAALTPVKAEGPAVMGSVITPDGVPAKSYSVIIEGVTAWGEKYDSFVTTDDNGVFIMMQLPPGTYVATPAGQPESSVKITIPSIPWYNFWATQEIKDVGNLSVTLGRKLRAK